MDGASISVVGVGGGGGNALGSMIRNGLGGVRTVAANTDQQALESHPADVKIALGGDLTNGRGAGANPEVGRQAAHESRDAVAEAIAGSDLVFVTAGMGGGTGTGAAPVVAEIARESGALTVGVVTRPFLFEGAKRRQQAEAGINALLPKVDALVVISNERLLETCGDDVGMLEAFDRADRVLLDAVQGISGLVMDVGYVNADFADLRTVLRHTGMALMGAGTSSGPQRLIRATQDAVSSPLLEGVGIDGAMGVLVNFRAGRNLGLRELSEAMDWLHQRVHPDADIVFGSVIDESMGEEARATIVATGFHRPARRLREAIPGYVEPSGPLFAQRRVRIPMAAYDMSLPRRR